uniref:Synembryn n=1 Tax=Electrophorus electricus TaxID=8005 RepID=A0A4W4GB84_ELEEL
MEHRYRQLAERERERDPSEENEQREGHRLAAALIWFVQSQLQPGVLRACLSTLRILSRDWQAQAPFITDSAILTLARLAGITCLPLPNEEEEVEVREGEAQPVFFVFLVSSLARLLTGLSEKLQNGIHSLSPPSGQFYDLRLLFLLTALRPELRKQQARGVSMLTAALGQCLEVRWAEGFEVVTDITAPPISKDATQRAMEILKSLFNVTYTVRRQISDEDEALYRHLVAMLRHCLLISFEEEDLADELQGHTVNLLSVLPLACLDVLLSVRLSEESRVSHGVNMDSVHALLLFMERRLDRGHKLKEKLTPVLNLLTESCRAHRETRHYLKQQILPPLREVALRPEQGNALRNKLVRLMTHVDTDLKHCSAELLFVLCKENVSRFVKYTGFGNAAGLLAEQGFLWDHGPSSQIQYSSDSDSDTEEYRNVRDRINPVTGQVEEPQPNPMEGMSEEEKEAEASRLVNMFNMLSRHKIIQPMRVAADGRLVPLGGQMRNNTLEEEEGEENEGVDSEEVD